MDAAIILLCGIPGAGKTTIARQIVMQHNSEAKEEVSWSFADRVSVERVTFDELYEEKMPAEAAFDPIQWKETQSEMERLVREQLTKAQNPSEKVCRVLLIDDNFYYRSMRKRFYHIAEAGDCGFGIIHVATSEEVCRRRNASREGAARVPESQFKRMIQEFEPLNSSFSFERNVFVLGEHSVENCSSKRTDATNVSSDPMQALSIVLCNAAVQLEERRRIQKASNAHLRQQIEDQKRTADNFVHSFDLASRKWISTVLNGEDAAFILASKDQKKALARALNERRKSLLLDMKASHSVIRANAGPAPDVTEDTFQLLARFRADMIRELVGT